MRHYVDWSNPTQGINPLLLKPTFLKRNLSTTGEATLIRSKLRYKIQQESYHMYYIVGSEDVFYKPSFNHKRKEINTSRWHELIK